MIKTLWTSAAMGALALAVAACAQTGASTTTSTASNAPSATRSQPATSANVTDAELTAFLAAREEIAPITSRYATMTSEERTQATAQIVDIQRRNNLTAARYDAISRAVQNDPALASRVLAEGGFTDAQLRAFAQASLEIDPISRGLANATPAEQTQAANQIREILERNNLDGATYNAIVAQAQTDAELSARIAALQVAAQASGTAE
jgi:hypothetical protein